MGEIWKRTWKDWSGRGWFVRTVCMGAFAVFIGYVLGPYLKMAHYAPWVGSLFAGLLAAILWGFVSLIILVLKIPGKIIAERDKILETAQTKIKELESSRPNLLTNVHPSPSGAAVAVLTIKNQGQRAERVSAELTFLQSEVAPVLHSSRFLSEMFERPISKNSELSAVIASIGGTSPNLVTWSFRLRDHERDRPQSVDLRSDLYPVIRHQSVTVKIKVTYHPDTLGEPIEWQVTFQEKSFTIKQLQPSPVLPSTTPPETTASEQSRPS